MVVFAFMLVSAMGMAALSVDLPSFDQAQREAQTAADAAVLAAVQDLPSGAAKVNADVQSYVAQNDPNVPSTILSYPGCMTATTPGICINYPYDQNASQLQVKLITTSPSYFGGLFGLSAAHISAQAAAGATSSNVGSAIFADSTTCIGGGVSITGGTNTINGATSSNAGLSITASGNTLGPTTYGGPNHCGSTVASGSAVNPPTGATQNNTTSPWPEDFSSAYPAACTLTADSWTWTNSSMAIPSGVYCANTSITIKGSFLTGKVTFIAPTLTVSGSSLSFTPDYNGLTYYQTGTTALQLSGTSINSGAVFAPNASVIITGSDISATGFIEAQSVVIKATGFTFTGNGPSASGGSFALIG
ncbi:MAG TPA: pilus assembly protein TadG-related protein [Solirubrobacteraceae bacterium]|jgi:hypothetical protein